MAMKPEAPTSAEQAEQIRRKLVIARTLVLGSYAGLLLLFTLLALITPEQSWKLWLVQVLPLVIFVPGLWRGYHRTYSWICFVVLIYFTWSVTNLISPLAYWRDGVVVVLSVTLFISAMMASRWRQEWFLWEHRSTE
ncbi:DUF2069 domain-containing protein [Marinimicrobium sp. C2-29]|uniref:DUF2069 domain-containing protein n=1 Tax=Marinimicrobium sp. C2-29 TaxID=3139825 RepID=UPI0031397081